MPSKTKSPFVLWAVLLLFFAFGILAIFSSRNQVSTPNLTKIHDDSKRTIAGSADEKATTANVTKSRPPPSNAVQSSASTDLESKVRGLHIELQTLLESRSASNAIAALRKVLALAKDKRTNHLLRHEALCYLGDALHKAGADLPGLERAEALNLVRDLLDDDETEIALKITALRSLGFSELPEGYDLAARELQRAREDFGEPAKSAAAVLMRSGEASHHDLVLQASASGHPVPGSAFVAFRLESGTQQAEIADAVRMGLRSPLLAAMPPDQFDAFSDATKATPSPKMIEYFTNSYFSVKPQQVVNSLRDLSSSGAQDVRGEALRQAIRISALLPETDEIDLLTFLQANASDSPELLSEVNSLISMIHNNR